MINFITENLPLVPFLLSLSALIISMIKDARRFRNAVLLMITLITMFAWCVFRAYRSSEFHSIIAIIMVVVFMILVLIVPFLLIADGFIMIRREGFSLTNLLAMFFGLMIIGGEVALLIYMTAEFEEHLTWIGTLLMLTGYAVFYASMVFLAFMFYSTGMRWLPRRVDYDYIVVLGCGLIEGDKVGRLLGNRLDKAVKVYNRSMSACKIICSGGQGPDETVSEAEAMKNYLIEHGISKKDIITEDQSKDTMENLKNSQAIIQKRGGRQLCAIVSSGYHILRASIYAARIGFPATGIGAHTALYYWPGAMIREYAALVKYYWRPYLLALLVSAFVLLKLVF